MTATEHRDLTQQTWFMYPQDVKRREGHPAPFPEKLPARLIKLYSLAATGDLGKLDAVLFRAIHDEHENLFD